MAARLKRTRCSYMERRAAATPALKLPRNALRGTHAVPSAPRRTSPDPAVDADRRAVYPDGAASCFRAVHKAQTRLGSRWLLARLAIYLRHARLPALPRAVRCVRLLSTGAGPAAALTLFLSITCISHAACAGPRTAAREHSVAVQLFAAASRLMVIAFECDAVSLVMMSGKPLNTLDATTRSFLHLF